jgi:hypothetical protein
MWPSFRDAQVHWYVRRALPCTTTCIFWTSESNAALRVCTQRQVGCPQLRSRPNAAPVRSGQRVLRARFRQRCCVCVPFAKITPEAGSSATNSSTAIRSPVSGDVIHAPQSLPLLPATATGQYSWPLRRSEAPLLRASFDDDSRHLASAHYDQALVESLAESRVALRVSRRVGSRRTAKLTAPTSAARRCGRRTRLPALRSRPGGCGSAHRRPG